MPTIFRWNIARREQLGRLVAGEPAQPNTDAPPWEPTFRSVLEDVRECSARVIAMAGDARLVFIGRSPECLYDYLTGALGGTSWARRPVALNLSLKGRDDSAWSTLDVPAREGVCEQFRALSLDPVSIASSAKPIALIDLIYAGETFGKLLDLLFAWSAAERVDVRAVRRRLRIVGITERKDKYHVPTQWKRLPWAARFRPQALKGVAIPWWFWSYLGDSEKKVSRSNPPWRWADPEMARPPRGPTHMAALRLALALHDAGRTREERDALAAAMAEQPAMRHAWCRVLAAELRAVSRPKRVERAFGSKQRVRSWRRHVRPRLPARR